MTKEVLVTVRGLQIAPDDEENEIEVIIPGEHFLKNGKHYVFYDEVIEDSTEKISNVIKCSEHCLEVTKKGAINTHMVFEKDKKNQSYYKTPFGNILVGIFANAVDIKEEEDSLTIDVEYVLDLNCEKIADCKIHICVRSREMGLL